MFAKLNIDSEEMQEIKSALNNCIDQAVMTVKDQSVATITLKIEMMSLDDYPDYELINEKEIDRITFSVNVVQKKEIEKDKGELDRIVMRKVGDVLVPFNPQVSMDEILTIEVKGEDHD